MQTATSKYQATIPEPVRKARSIDLAFAKGIESTLTEWATAEDEQAYRDL